MALTKLQAAVIEGVLGLTWQSPAKTSSFAAAIGNGYYLNTTTGAITVTLPSSPTVGDSIGIIDYAGTAASNTITLTSSNNIQGSSDDKIVNYTRGALRITYADTTQGWVASAAANDGTSALNPLPPIVVDFLVVAGGASGGAYYYNGGGGAGGLRTSYTGGSGGNQPSENSLSLSLSIPYTITVGTPGAARTTRDAVGEDGQPSSITDGASISIVSTGGGGGATEAIGGGARTGGSGGGARGSGSGNTTGGLAVTSPVIQGFDGGDGTTNGSGGGGGAGFVGGGGANGASGNGGLGLQVNIDGLNNFYAGGGGGGGGNPSNSNVGLGGSGIGGNGATYEPSITSRQATAGATNTGSGGGGGSHNATNTGSSGAGGSGIVILRCTKATATIGSGITVNGINVAGSVNGIAISGTSDYHYSATLGTGTITFS